MNKKPLVLVLIIVIVIIAGVFFYSPKTLTNLISKLTSGIKIEKVSGGILGINKNSDLGELLTDSNGRTLYVFGSDPNGKSVCYNQCEITWPPFMFDATIDLQSLTENLNKRLNVIKRDDDSKQFSYGNKPLYYFTGDLNPGDVNGNGVNNLWSVVLITP